MILRRLARTSSMAVGSCGRDARTTKVPDQRMNNRAGYFPPLSDEAHWIVQGRHICRPYRGTEEIVGEEFIPSRR